jgi:hypothetical protein
MYQKVRHHRVAAAALLATLVVAACTDGVTSPPLPQGQPVGIVLNSTDRSLTVIDIDSTRSPSTIGLGPDGTPVTLAAHGATVVVPMGVVPVAVIVDLAAQRVVYNVALPANSGATGVAFLNDSIALVANTNLGSVTPVNVRNGTTGAAIQVGVFPQAMAAVRDTVFVVNANLVNFEPAGPSSLSVIAGTPPRVIATVPLSGRNAGAAAPGNDGYIYVVHSGSFGSGDGSVSVVDRRTVAEVQHVPGFGEFPSGIAVSSDGRVHVSSFSYGMAVWDAGTGFLRVPAGAVQPAGIASVSGVGVDPANRLYALRPDCRGPAAAYRLAVDFAIEREWPTGTCPLAITFATLPS